MGGERRGEVGRPTLVGDNPVVREKIKSLA